MAHIAFSTQTHSLVINPINHNARMVAKPQFVSGKEGSVVRIDVLTPGEIVDGVVGKKRRAKMMHSAYWLDPDEAIALAEALKASATLAKHYDHCDEMLFEEIRLQGFLNGK